MKWESALYPEARFFLRLCFFCFCVLSVFRLVFLVVQFSEFQTVPWFEIALGFVHGLRFDAATIAYGVIVGFVLSHVPFLNRWAVFRVVWIVFMNAFFLFVLVLSFVDVIFFEFTRKRIGFEVFVYLTSSELPAAVWGTIEAYSLVALVAFIGLGLTGWGSVKLLKNKEVLRYQRTTPRARVIGFCCGFPLLFFLVGGVCFDGRCLSVWPTLFNRFHVINVFSVNPAYMALTPLRFWNEHPLMDSGEAQQVVSSLLRIEKRDLVDPQYPLFRKTGSVSMKRRNVVVVLMESWSALYAGPFSDPPGVTPAFNKLVDEGLYFDRFFASGFVSRLAIYSALRGVPTPFSRIGVDSNTRFASLCSLLKTHGYRCFGFTGVPASVDGLDELLRLDRFDRFVSSADFDLSKTTYGTDRVFDGFLFQKAADVIKENADRPFLVFIKSESSHYPCSLPPLLSEKHAVFGPKDHAAHRCLNSFRYSDWALGEFVENLRQENFFDNTVFVITADHTIHQGLDLIQNQHVPCLVYAPGIVPPGRSSVVGSHLDVLPTIAGILGLSHHASLGRDLRTISSDDGFALFQQNAQTVGWIDSQYVGLMNLQDRSMLLYDHRPGDFSVDLKSRLPAVTQSLKERILAFWQLNQDLERADKVVPEEGL